jgi:hypothetical protein
MRVYLDSNLFRIISKYSRLSRDSWIITAIITDKGVLKLAPLGGCRDRQIDNTDDQRHAGGHLPCFGFILPGIPG